MAKKTIENCTVIKSAVWYGIGSPKLFNGKCEGYTNGDGNEPIVKCQRCKLLLEELKEE